jgi:hypothetical protein
MEGVPSEGIWANPRSGRRTSDIAMNNLFISVIKYVKSLQIYHYMDNNPLNCNSKTQKNVSKA